MAFRCCWLISLIVPTLCVGMLPVTLRVTLSGRLRALQFAIAAGGEAGLARFWDLIAEEVGDFTVGAGYDAAQKLLRENSLDTLICANDASAIGALTAARELGVDVPETLSIVGFDDIEMAGWPAFNLSTINNPIDLSVEHVITLLEKRLAEPAKASETLLIEPFFVPRGTH